MDVLRFWIVLSALPLLGVLEVLVSWAPFYPEVRVRRRSGLPPATCSHMGRRVAMYVLAPPARMRIADA